MPSDAALLCRYVEEKDESAFAELVRLHLGLVYGAALRRTGRSHLAEEVAQKVFTDLARKAAGLVRHPTLAGWLYRSARYAAIDAVRAEVRRTKLADNLATMSDETPQPEEAIDWERLRPVLDDAIDHLRERDREIMLLRFFSGMTFEEVGARMKLSENAARMRTERALDKLRAHLARRGITSTSAALGLMLANQTMVAAPAGLAASVTATSLATASAGGAFTLVSVIIMSKLTAPIVSAALAAGLTALVWTSVADDVSSDELSALRQENARLVQATAKDASTESIARVADEYAAQAAAIGQTMAERHAARVAVSQTAAEGGPTGVPDEPIKTARGHFDHGRATARDAAYTFAWACDTCDPVDLAKTITFDPAGREAALAVLGSMPEAIRAQYHTPEELYGMLLAAACIEAPPPGADVIERFMVEVELRPGRVAMRRTGSTVNNHEYQLTSDGWKYVVPEGGVRGLVNILNSETLARLGSH